MKTKPCERIQDDLKAYIDNELPLLKRLVTRRHLNQCAACQEEKQIMEAIGEELRAATPAPTMNDTLRSRLLATVAAIDPANAAPEKAAQPLWRRQPALVFGTIMATLVAAGFIIVPTVLHSTENGGLVAASSASAGVALNQYTQDYDEKMPAGGAMPGGAPATASAPALSGRAASDMASSEAGRTASTARVSRAQAKVTTNTVPARPEFGVTKELADARQTRQVLPSFERQVHREASLGIAVAPDQLEIKSNSIEESVKAVGGYIASNNLTTDSDGYRSADIDAKVPVNQFDSMLKKFGELGKITSKNITGEDLTEKVSDSQSAEQVLVNEVQESERRVRNSARSDWRLGQKEAELRESRIRLAQERARLGLLRRMSTLATIHVQLTEKAKPVKVVPPKTGFWSGMDDTNHAAMAAFQTAVRVPVILVMWILAFSPIWAPLIVAYRWASRRGNLATKTVVSRSEESTP